MTVGMVGLGEMGSGFVDRLLLAKIDVLGWNRTKSKAEPLIAKGMTWADSPRAVAQGCDVVLTMVTNDQALTAVCEGDDGVLGAIAGKTLVEMSTVGTAHVQALATKAKAAGGELLDAPVLGSQVSIQQGKLLIMVGGDKAALERIRPVLEAIGPKVFHVGDVGQAKTMKIALNLQLSTQILALSEGLLLAVKSGIPRDVALDIMLSGATASPMLQYRGPLIKEQPQKAWFDCTMMQKDLDLALQLGEKLGVPLPTTSTTNAWLTAARGQGLSHHDFSVLYYVLAKAAGENLEISDGQMTAVAMPQLGESVSEGTVVRWLKAVGDNVAVDEPLFEVATDKVNTEIPSLYAGVLREILVPDGTTVPVGTELARIADAGARTSVAGSGSRAHLRSPVVRRLAREHQLDLTAVRGTGAGGRITRSDVLALAGTATATAVAPHAAAQPLGCAGRCIIGRAPDRHTVLAVAAQIAANVLVSKRAVADVFSVIEADMESVNAVRASAGLTYLPFIARAAVIALRAFPAVNGRIDENSLVHNESVHLGVAVDLDEAGLVVPVIRDADGLTVTGLARAIVSRAAGARASKLVASDYSGSTFTITNNGSYGTLMTAPIVNFPNVATLSTDAIEERVVPHGGGIAIRRRMYLCMSWDHRAFDGSTAGKFMARIKHELQERDWSTQL